MDMRKNDLQKFVIQVFFFGLFFSRAIFLIAHNPQSYFPKTAFLEVGLVSCICYGFLGAMESAYIT